MPCFVIWVLLCANFCFLTDVVLAQQTVFRLSCQRNAIFNFVGHDKRCPTGILWTGVAKAVTRCYQRCVSVNKYNGANIKEETQGKVKCELVEGFFNSAKCKLMKEDGWQYFEALSIHPSNILESGTYMEKRNSRYSMEKELTPEIYIPFDAVYCGNTIFYERGQDDMGKKSVTIKGALVAKDANLSRMVTVMAEPKLINLGNFSEHRMNKPDGQSFTVSLWTKTSSQQKRKRESTYLGCGNPREEGFFIKQRQYGEQIIAGYVYSKTLTRYYLIVPIPKRLPGWNHIVMTFVLSESDKEPALAFYMNGARMASTYSTTLLSHTLASNPYLWLGEFQSFSRFAYWSRVLTSEQIAAIYLGR